MEIFGILFRIVSRSTPRVMLNTAGEAGEAGEAGDVFSRPSYDSPGVPGGGRRHATRLSR